MKRFNYSLIIIAIFIFTKLSFAQFFGKNNVQYTVFDWQYIQSKHFDIYFYPGNDVAAEFVADVAESSYVSLSSSWNYKLKSRIVIILYKSHNDFGQTNLNFAPPEESVGGFTEFFKNRVVIPYEGSYEQLRHVTHHELTHAIMLQMLFGPKHQSILAGISRTRIPLWFIEGLAEYESRGWDTESDMFIRDAVINGYIPPIDYLYAFLAYKGGQSLLYFISEKYGSRKIGELLTKVRYSKNVERGLKQSIGIGIEELNIQWQRYLKETYWPDIDDFEEPGNFAKQITFHLEEKNFINNSGELSPQSDKIAYISDKSGFFDIYLVSVIDVSKRTKLVSGQRSGMLEELHWLRPGISWSPDGNFIVFAAKSREQDALHIVDVNRKKIIQSYKFNLDGLYSPDWSPDGNEIAFVGSQNGSSDIYIYNLNSKDLRTVTHDIFSDLEPRWSPNGQEIVFISDRSEYLSPDQVPINFKIQTSNYHQFDIYLVNVSIGNIARITDTETNEKSPVWSPDGTKMAFVSDRSGIFNIYIKNMSPIKNKDDLIFKTSGGNSSNGNNDVHAYEQGIYPITNILTGIDHLSWKGDRVCFTSFFKGGFDLYLLKNPLDIKPFEAKPTYTNFLKKKQKEQSETLSNEHHAPQEQNYQNFVFGKKFKKGRPISEHAPKPGLFLSQTDYKSDGGKYSVNKYKRKFSADIVTGGAGFDPFFGFQGGAIISISDLMGSHRINIITDLFVDIKNSDFSVSYYYLPRQTDYSIGIFRFNYLFFSQGRFLVRDRNLGLNFLMSRPFDRYRRIQFGVNFRDISREGLVDLEENEIQYKNRSTRVLLTTLAYVKDNIIWGYTGPKAGSRYNLSIQASPDLGAGGLDFRIYKGDCRTYFNFKKKYTFAVKLSGGFSEGRHKQKFFLGGLANWMNLSFRDDIEINIEDIYFSQFVTPVRGFNYYEQVGSKFFLANFELRIPFVNYIDMTWPLPLKFANIRGSLFTDVGSAWDHDFNFITKTPGGGIKLDDVLMSFGWGMRVNLGIFLLKYDIAWRTDFTGIFKSRKLFSIGADF